MSDKTAITLELPENCSFWPTVFSHGWCDLSPFGYDDETRTLYRIHEISSVPLKLTVTGKGRSVNIAAEGKDAFSNSENAEIECIIARCLQFDQDLSGFYGLLEGYPEHCWVREHQAGRLLRCPDLFEDTVKTICTTNCTWGQTKGMVRRLCENYGKRFGEKEYTFPGPETLAEASEKDLKTVCKLGYRASYVKEFADKVGGGDIDLAEWENADTDSKSLKKRIKSVKGVGDYAAENILKLLGRFDYPAVDSWVRKKFSEKHAGGKKVLDREIEEYYSQFGKWSGLVLWCEMFGQYLQQSGKSL